MKINSLFEEDVNLGSVPFLSFLFSFERREILFEPKEFKGC